MAKFELEAGEQLIKQGDVGYLKSRLKFAPGYGHLTDRRFVHTSTLRARAVGGLLGALLSKGRVDLDLPLGSIAWVSRGRHGRKQSVLVVGTRDGKEHRLLTAFDEWFTALGGVLSAHQGARLVESGTGNWQVHAAR